MMTMEQPASGHERDEHLVAMLRQAQALPPAGFAARTAARFAAAVERRRLRHLLALGAALFVLSSTIVWLLLLNVQNAAGTARSSLTAFLTVIDIIFTLWQRMPFVLGTLTVGMLAAALLAGGLLGKVYRDRVWVK